MTLDQLERATIIKNEIEDLKHLLKRIDCVGLNINFPVYTNYILPIEFITSIKELTINDIKFKLSILEAEFNIL